MEKMKLISVRIDEDTLTKIDAVAHDSLYWKRSDIIRGLLAAIVNNCNRHDTLRIAKKAVGYPLDYDFDIELVPKVLQHVDPDC